MSAWPEAVYVINKINYAIDAKLDIDENGIRNINNLNARVDELNLLVEDPSTDPPTGIVPTQNEINDLLADIEDSDLNHEYLEYITPELLQNITIFMKIT